MWERPEGSGVGWLSGSLTELQLSRGSSESFSFVCSSNKKSIQLYVLLPPFEDGVETWYCTVFKQIHHSTAKALFRWCLSTKFCTDSHILYISQMSFKVRESSVFLSFTSAEQDSPITSCPGYMITHNSTARDRRTLVQLWSCHVHCHIWLCSDFKTWFNHPVKIY